MDKMTANATLTHKAAKSVGDTWSAAKTERYIRLSRLDREHAASLEHACRMSPRAKVLSRRLANRSLIQCLRTAIPLMIADFVTMWVLLFVVTAIVERLFQLPTNMVTRNTALVASLLLLPIARMKGCYPAIGMSPVVEFREIVQSAAVALCIFAACEIIAHSANAAYVVLSAAVTLICAVPILPTVRYLVRSYCSQLKWWGVPVLLHASPDVATELYYRIAENPALGMRPVGVLLNSSDYWDSSDRITCMGIQTCDIRHTLDFCVQHDATWLVIGGTGCEGAGFPNISPEVNTELNAIPNRILLTTGRLDFGMWDRTHTIGSVIGLWLSSPRQSDTHVALKRFVDLAVGSVVGLFFLPPIIVIAIAIRLSSPGPIFYSQQRIGRGGKTFLAWKFRSMVVNADQVLRSMLDSNPAYRKEWDETHKLKKDPRVTWIGKIIRTTSLDELPQIWNILTGDMSLVGPRPLVDSPTYDASYIHAYPNEFATYCSVRPGLTGLWQVTCRNNGVYELRIYLDMVYIRNASFWMDLFIILRTIRTLVMREGAS